MTSETNTKSTTPITDILEIKPVIEKPQKISYPFWYGGASSMFACLFTHPLDLAKVRLQTAAQPGDNLVKMAVRIVSQEGILAAYSGLSASLLRQATYSTARFGVYEALKEYDMERNDHQAPSTIKLLSYSVVAGVIGGIVGNPSDIVNIRMQNDNTLPIAERRHYRNAVDGIYRIIKEEGVSSLFRGVYPNLTRGVLMTASQVVSYDIGKQLLVNEFSWDPKSKNTHFGASLFAGLVATTVCSPVDVVKTRIMNASSAENSNAISILMNAVKNEGVGFMFRGWTPAFIRLGPHTILTFLAMEQLRHYKVGL
ncbi:unnamed protein product [[Candida] boidinii]|uniref:Unnamed protein product n=1 Tax=Candida boidinii TaxID=5477 RepID=A0A9W6T0K0_CANBO|nr:hypothetical protein B5S30_g1750 [[Candida] boidinii]GME68600.1 unnamed protein product [[Candida] boidinii]GMF99964.1 unnamed protein product [[Candida] boidinii]